MILLLQNIEAGSYSAELLEKGIELLTELDLRAAADGHLTAASVQYTIAPTSLGLSDAVPLSVSQALASLEWESWMKVTAVE
jgi:hypothetical protein